jgi:peptidoglycan/LPS O-acetylase OafA/YrhL
MTGSPGDLPRLGWLDGLRGLAASQVVLLHYASAFLPAIGLRERNLVRYGWETAFIRTPLFLPFDGYSAVYIFFILSGVALSYSFAARPYAIAPSVIRRIIRLGVPMLVAMLLGGLWYSLWPEAHVVASHITGSVTWLGAVGPDSGAPTTIFHQVGLEGLFAGYQEVSLLPQRVQTFLGLLPLARSFDAPLWTLHVEFVGSLLILGLVALRQAIGRYPHLIVCLLLTGALLSSLLFLFIVGHLAAESLRSSPARRQTPVLGVGLLALGVLLCTTNTLGAMIWLHKFLPRPFIGHWAQPDVMQSMYGAVAIFFGIACLPRFQLMLTRPMLRWLGQISFSLYLTHFPVLFTLVSATFIVLVADMPYLLAAAVVTLAGWLLSLTIAAVFEALVDRPSIGFSRLVFRRLVRRR